MEGNGHMWGQKDPHGSEKGTFGNEKGIREDTKVNIWERKGRIRGGKGTYGNEEGTCGNEKITY